MSINNSDIIQLRIPSKPALLGGFLNLALRKPMVISIHGDICEIVHQRTKAIFTRIFFCRIVNPLIKILTKRSHLNILMGKQLSHLAAGNSQVFPANYQFMETDLFHRKDTCSTDTIKILYTGSITKSKGIIDLIEAFHFLISIGRNLELHLVGDITDKTIDINLLNHKAIKHFGFVPWGSELFSFYRKSDILVFPSLSEGNPKVPMEALANSLPVICTPIGSSNYIIDQWNGLFSKLEIFKISLTRLN